jgi:hypothetical protein
VFRPSTRIAAIIKTTMVRKKQGQGTLRSPIKEHANEVPTSVRDLQHHWQRGPLDQQELQMVYLCSLSFSTFMDNSKTYHICCSNMSILREGEKPLKLPIVQLWPHQPSVQ